MNDQRQWLMVLVVCVACGVLVPAGTAAQDRIFAPDSSASIVLPPSFQPLVLHDDAVLQFADSLSESYIMMLLEDKQDLVGWNLTRHSMVTVAQIVATLDMPEVVGPVATTIGGHPAVQYSFRGAMQGTRVAYLHTAVETPHTFAQVLAWTMASRWNANERLMRDAVASTEFPVPIGSVSDDVYDIVPGTWAWDRGDEEPCTGLRQRFEIAEDGETMKIHHSEPIESAPGDTTSVTNYVIEDAGYLVLNTYIPDETRLTDAGDRVKWDLVVIGRNRIAWHRADWAEGGLTGMLRRCGN